MSKFKDYCNKNPYDEEQLNKLNRFNRQIQKELKQAEEQVKKQEYLLKKLKKADKLIGEYDALK